MQVLKCGIKSESINRKLPHPKVEIKAKGIIKQETLHPLRAVSSNRTHHYLGKKTYRISRRIKRCGGWRIAIKTHCSSDERRLLCKKSIENPNWFAAAQGLRLRSIVAAAIDGFSARNPLKTQTGSRTDGGVPEKTLAIWWRRFESDGWPPGASIKLTFSAAPSLINLKIIVALLHLE